MVLEGKKKRRGEEVNFWQILPQPPSKEASSVKQDLGALFRCQLAVPNSQ